jgi:hypothetical protein
VEINGDDDIVLLKVPTGRYEHTTAIPTAKASDKGALRHLQTSCVFNFGFGQPIFSKDLMAFLVLGPSANTGT